MRNIYQTYRKSNIDSANNTKAAVAQQGERETEENTLNDFRNLEVACSIHVRGTFPE